MPLVDYASDSDASSASFPGADQPPSDTPPRKKPRTASPRPAGSQSPTQAAGGRSGSGPVSAAVASSPAALPPLPPSFHDLYASTVRTATRDDPALHQGRVRQNPHVPGNWPSHVYIEWHPPSDVHALLTELVSSLQEQLVTTAPAGSERVEITSFLTSDLATPQPLHISLSRPLALSSEQKDEFLCDVEAAIKASGIPRFTVACSKAEWHRTPESGRSFLVLRVESRSSDSGETTSTSAGTTAINNSNLELTGLLRLCNATAERHGQPGLYLWATDNGGDRDDDGEERVGRAFHVSIAWSFAEPTKELRNATEWVFCSQEATRKIQEVQIPIDGVKVKIGNIVTHAGLRDSETRARGRVTGSLLGL
ncbi:hypothetical protein C8A05DRAFT_11245 [Staphylotrichum tortipilum]|uniref:U6 snRNA phosphodiesterase n=1 Tax=Staphylotrichum tortipilum TaxID=2831512 RepID=A0AAN6MU75_9PEZI|nr:hypothetical protein C8A05DRAFT_40203 [Staphylotrichum longicolle]KAK3907059.1 hypothetical protein C8A05DRAFT_11245 [Staphylotrichum longicolle]